MPAERFLGLDIGTSSLKACLADGEGQPLAGASLPLEYRAPEGLPLARELDAEGLVEACARLVADLLERTGTPPGAVRGVGLTGQRQGFALVDGAGRVLYAGPNLDLRAVFEGMEVDAGQGEEVYRATGHLPSLFFAPARLLWFRRHRPEVLASARFLLPLPSLLALRLTGETGTDPSSLGELGLLEVATGRPARGLLEPLGLGADLLPPLVPAGQALGRVRPGSGLPLEPGTPIALAGPDTFCALLGMGTVEEGEVGLVTGWSLPLLALTSAPTPDPRRRTWVGLFPLPGRWAAEASTGDGGQAYRWLHDLLFGPGADAYREMEALARRVPPGAEGTMAFLGPRPLDLSRPGMRRGGVLLPVPLTFSPVGRGHLVRALLENLAFAVRGARDLLAGVVARPLTPLSVGGGFLRTPLFLEVLAAALGEPLRVAPHPMTAALGACLAGASAAGPAPLEGLARRQGARRRTVEPDPELAAEYRGLYELWRKSLQEVEGDDALGG